MYTLKHCPSLTGKSICKSPFQVVFTLKLHLYKHLYQCQCYPKGIEGFHCRLVHLWASCIKFKREMCDALDLTSDWSPCSKCVCESIFPPSTSLASRYYKHSNLTQQQTLLTEIQLCLSTKQFHIDFRYENT